MRAVHTTAHLGLKSWPLLLALTAIVGCPDGSSGSGGGGGMGTGGTGGTDVVPAEVECGEIVGHAGAIQDSWRDGNPVNTYELTMPSDPWGGILTVAVSSEIVSTEVEIAMDGQEGFVAQAGPTGGAQVAFESAPSETYVIRALLDSPGANSFPIPFLVTWGFSVRPDCYEPNDTYEEAATIVIGEDVEAYLLKNRGSVEHQAATELEDQHTDWYAFTLDTSSPLTVDIAKLPSDVIARFALYNSLAQAIPKAEWIQPDGETSGSLVLPNLPEGDYYLSVTVDAFEEGSGSAKNDEPLPDHFVTPYRFQLNIPTFPMNTTCYVPTMFTNALTNRWLDPGDEKIEQITAPADPGGGIFEVEIKTVEDGTGRRVLPGIQVRIPGVGTSVAGDNPADGITKVAFETGPAQTFNVHVEIANSPAAFSYPHNYQMIWKFEPRRDCHEPNETSASAARISLGNKVEGYHLQRRGSAGHNASEHDDWYEFTLPIAGPLLLEILTAPTDTSMTFKMFDANLDPVGDVWRQTGGVSSGSVLVPMLLPGTYFLGVTGGTFADGGQWQSQDPPTNRPDHFETPYELRLSVP